MIRGLYTAASGLIASLRQQGMVANNIANLSTPGYRGETYAEGSFASVLVRSIGNSAVPVPVTLRRTVGAVGTGVYIAERSSYLSDGTLLPSGSPLDLAIRGRGLFTVQGPSGTMYTRNGHFRRDGSGLLVTGDGFPVLGTDGQPIAIDGDGVRITSRGAVFVDEQQVGTLQIVENPARSLVRAGGGAFVAAGGAAPAEAAGVVVQGALEESNIDIGRAATRLFSISRRFAANQRVFLTVDENLERAVREIGRVG